ncbi:unnamed protein product [Amoebophrya sp. A120]|nr:unnamed protein product [Amoebophrya sp. A120]|eukprot:GSA120T00014084001.1
MPETLVPKQPALASHGVTAVGVVRGQHQADHDVSSSSTTAKAKSATTSSKQDPHLFPTVDELQELTPRSKVKALITDIRGKANSIKKALDRAKHAAKNVEAAEALARRRGEEFSREGDEQNHPGARAREATSSRGGVKSQLGDYVSDSSSSTATAASARTKETGLAPRPSVSDKNNKDPTTAFLDFENDPSFKKELLQQFLQKLSASWLRELRPVFLKLEDLEKKLSRCEDLFFRAKHAILEKELRKLLVVHK